MYKYFLLLIVTFINVLPSFAEIINAEIGCFNYELDTTTKTASAVRYKYFNGGSGPGFDFGKVEVPSHVTYKDTEFTVVELGRYCFSNCNKVTEITIPQTIKTISPGQYDLPKLKKIKIESLKSWYNTNLTYYLTDHLFSLEVNGVNIEHLIIPDDVEKINKYAFCYTDIKRLVVSDNIAEIPYEAFLGCSNLEYAEINSKKICNSAFRGCSKLAEIYIKKQIKEIEYSAFIDCTNLNKVRIDDIASWCDVNFHGRESNPLFYAKSLAVGANDVKDLQIPEGIKTINNYTFINGDFEHINIPSSVDSIKGLAFKGCSNINEIKIPDKLSYLGYEAFADCVNLTNIVITPNIKEIKEGAFSGCASIKGSIVIPASVTFIGERAFVNTGLKYVYSFAKLKSYISGKAFPENSIIYVPEKYIKHYSYYDGNNKFVYKLYNEEVSQTKITLSSTKYFELTNVIIDGKQIQMNHDMKFEMSSLIPAKEYTMSIKGNINGDNIEGDIMIETLEPELDLQLFSATNTKLKLKGIRKGDMTIVKEYFSDSNSGKEYGEGYDYNGWREIVVEGFYPGQWVSVTYTIQTKDGSTFSVVKSFETKRIDITATTKSTGTSCELIGKNNNIDATIISSGFEESKSDRLTITGLDPNTTYQRRYYLTTKEGGTIFQNISFTTKSLELETLQPKGVTNTCSIVSAISNIDDDEVTAGFQWIKYDAPSSLKPNEGYATVYNGTLEGYIKNLQTTSYYKVRAFYKSQSEKYYYGNWVTFDPSDFSYFEPTVHTYKSAEINGNTAKIKGVVLQGSDDITEQGFEYWSENSNKARQVNAGKQIVYADGQRMEAELTNLAENTTYHYRAFAKTAKNTTYGETLQFETPATSSIQQTEDEKGNTLKVGVRTNNGLQLSVSETNNKCSYKIYSMTGNTIVAGNIMADGEWYNVNNSNLQPGVYIIQVYDGKKITSAKVAVK